MMAGEVSSCRSQKEGCGQVFIRFFPVLRPTEVTNSPPGTSTVLGTEWVLSNNHNSGNLSSGLYFSTYQLGVLGKSPDFSQPQFSHLVGCENNQRYPWKLAGKGISSGLRIKHKPSRTGHPEGDTDMCVLLIITVLTRDSRHSHPRTSLAPPRFPLSPSLVRAPCWGLGPGLPVMGHCPCPARTRRAQLALVTGQLLHTNPQGLADALTRGGVREGSISGSDTAPGAGG